MPARSLAKLAVSVLFVIAVGAVLAACFSPSLDRCTVRCKGDEPCPGGMVCSDDNYCHAADDGNACDPQMFDVTVNRDGQGAGRVVGRNLDCASMQATECKTSATEGMYEISVVSDPDSRVLAWKIDGQARDDCATLDRCEFELVQDTTVDVTFSAGRTLKLDVAGRGSNVKVSSQDGKLACTLADGTCTQGYELGTTVTLDAAPGSPFFRGFTGCSSSTSNSCTVVLDDNTTITATFEILQVQLLGVPSYGGMLTLNGQDCANQNCTYELAPGMQTLSLFAVPQTIYELDRWVNTPCENQVPSPNPCVYSTSTDQIAIAIYKEAPTVKVNSPAFGTGSISMSGTHKGALVNRTCIDAGTPVACVEHFDAGSTVTLKANVQPGHLFKSWSSCPNTVQENQATCTFTIPSGLHRTVSPLIQ